jgi:hypothetical protein
MGLPPKEPEEEKREEKEEKKVRNRGLHFRIQLFKQD